MSFEYTLKLDLPGTGTGTQEDPCQVGSVHVKAGYTGTLDSSHTGNIFEGLYVKGAVDPLFPETPWSWYGREPVNWDAHWAIRGVHKDVELAVRVSNKNGGSPSKTVRFWLQRGIPVPYSTPVRCNDGNLRMRMDKFIYVRDDGILTNDIYFWYYNGTKEQLSLIADDIPDDVFVINTTDGKVTTNREGRYYLQENLLVYYDASFSSDNRQLLTVGPVNDATIIQSLTEGGHEVNDSEPVDPPDPNPDPVDPPEEVTYKIYCSGDAVYVEVLAYQYTWLLSNGHIQAFANGLSAFNGTSAQLNDLITTIPEPEPEPEPEPDPTPPSHWEPPNVKGLQMCFAPKEGRDYSVDDPNVFNTSVTPEQAIQEMKMMGVQAINLWITTQHLFYGVAFTETNPIIKKYLTDFINEAHEQGMVVIGKLPQWGMPNWFAPKAGIPDVGSALYNQHLDAHVAMAKTINATFNLDAIMLGNEPQWECKKYDSEELHVPEDCLQINIDKITAIAKEFKCAVIAPVSSPHLLLVRPDAIDPTEFLERMIPTLEAEGVCAVNTNPYQVVTGSVPTYNNYVVPHKELSDLFTVWCSEQNTAMEWVNGNSHIRAEHVRALAELTPKFSDVFSLFLYQDFEDKNNWGVRTNSGTLTHLYVLMQELFGTDMQDGYGLPLRCTEGWDTGIHITNLSDEIKFVTLKFYAEGVPGQYEPMQIGDPINLTCPPSGPIVRNVLGDLHIDGNPALVKLYVHDGILEVMGVWWDGDGKFMFPVQGYML